MNVHKNARLTPRGRERIVRQVESGQAPKAVAETAGVCPRTVRKWVDRYAVKDWQACRIAHPGRVGCADRRLGRLSRRSNGCGANAGRASRSPPRAASPQPPSAVRRLGLNKLSALEPAEPVRRYERETPGELIHIDIKKLGRIGSIGHRITGRHPGAVNRHHGIGWEGTVGNFVREAMMMERGESSHGYREKTSGPVACWARSERGFCKGRPA